MDRSSDPKQESGDALTDPPANAFSVYCNQSPRLIILRCIGSQHFFLEKAIFPWEHYCFVCPPFSRVELWSYGMAGVELLDAMDAEELHHPCLQARSGDSEARRSLSPQPDGELPEPPWLDEEGKASRLRPSQLTPA